MKKKVKEPFLAARTMNMILGFVVLMLILVVIYKDSETKLLEIIIFALASIGNFIAATVDFSEKKKLRGNLYAFACAFFFIAAVVTTIRFLGMI